MTCTTPYHPRLFRLAAPTAMALLLCACGGQNLPPSAEQVPNTPSKLERCSAVESIPTDQHLITAWKTAPSDALITHPISGLSVRQAFAPHYSGERMRLRLSNHYSSLPVTLENVHIAQESSPGLADMVPGSECLLRFDGETKVTIPAGESVVSDLIAYPLRAFERVGISFYAPEFTPQITRHLNANEVLFMSLPGDHAADPTGTAFIPVPDGYAANFLAIEALEVAAPQTVTTLVAVGDSITDGSDSTTGFLDGEGSPLLATDQRYPNHLQHRLNEAGMPISVANAGIGGSELLADGWLPQFGRSLLERLDVDVLQVTGATQVLLMIGTNDLGNPKPGPAPTPADLIAGYTDVIQRIHAAGMRVILGTIPPADGAVIDGLPIVGPILGQLPLGIMHGTAQAREARDAVNAWIREQTLSDGMVDFDACLEDPNRPGYIAPEYNSGDNLHPSPAGYAAMAQCVDLELLRQAPSL